MNLKVKRNIPIAFTLIAFLSILATVLGDQPILAYVFS